MAKVKKLTDKQIKAVELLTSGKGLKYSTICEQVGVNNKTLYRWMYEPEFAHFQAELERINNERWEAIVDAARASAMRLIQGDNPKIVEFVLKNAGYNPTLNIDADITTDITINIDEDE